MRDVSNSNRARENSISDQTLINFHFENKQPKKYCSKNTGFFVGNSVRVVTRVHDAGFYNVKALILYSLCDNYLPLFQTEYEHSLVDVRLQHAKY